MPGNRDDFPKTVIRKLAERVCFCCSSPGCRNPTVGPSSDPNASIILGKAAHITAAAKGGPRYDPTLTPIERRSIQNGIWLCGIHAELIDKDKAAYPVTLLRQWKEQAEEHAAREAFTSKDGKSSKVVFELSDEDREFLRTLALPPEDSTESIVARLSEAVRSDLQAFVDAQETAAHAISLHLTLLGSTEVTTDLMGLARGISVLSAVALVSPPGTGKTTTLIQLAETILESRASVAMYIPLGEWEGTGVTWFETLIRRNAFRSFKPQHFMQLAYQGQLILLLDGWNELSPEASRHAHKQLSALQRDFPQLGIVIGTRQQTYPVKARIVRVEPLNEDQQLQLAVKLRGAEGEQLLDQAWRTSGLRELVTIPLYLKALLLGVRGATLPDSKDAVLSSFVKQHESAPDKAVLLRRVLLGLHPEILAELATEANASGTTALAEEQARAAVAKVVTRLQASGQLTAPLQPATVIDTLVDSHVLTRIAAAGNISFQHQQFQEWYASFHAERLILAAASGDATARRSLHESILDRPAWEESILFACERLSRKDPSGVTAVANAIIDTLGIDPMLAADMIQRSAEDVWRQAQVPVVQFAVRWHVPGNLDRAMRFMMMTGRADFSYIFWPFLADSNDQVFRHAIRIAKRFRPSVLGPDAAGRLAALPDSQRGDVLVEIVYQSGVDGIELAANFAKIERQPQIVAEVLEALEFRGSMRHVTEILAKADEPVWLAIAKRGTIRELVDSAQHERLSEIRRQLYESESDPIKKAHLLLYSRVNGVDAEVFLGHVLKSDTLQTESDQSRSLVREVSKRFPMVAVDAMASRLQAGLAVPTGIEGVLDKVPVADSGPIAEAALTPGVLYPKREALCRMIGPVTVGKIIDLLIACEARLKGQPYNEAASEAFFAFRRTITGSRQESFISALLTRADTTDAQDIRSLAELIHLHGRHTNHVPMVLSPEDRGRLVAMLLRWSAILLAAPDATRHHIADLMKAMARVPASEFVPVIDTMLKRDMVETAREMEEQKKMRKSVVRMSYDNWYRATLSAIGGAQVSALMVAYLPDLQFGIEAAHVLLDIWSRDHPSARDGGFPVWHDYSGVRSLRDRGDASMLVKSEYADAMWKVVRQYGTTSESPERQRHAVNVGCVAMRMSFGSHPPELEELFKLPIPYDAKKDLFVVAARSGVALSAAMLTEAIRELLSSAQTQPWRLDENHGDLMTWIELFAFSDQPVAVLTCLDLLTPDFRVAHRLQRLVNALGQSHHADALGVLMALAQRDQSITDDGDWLAALVRLNSIEAARALLESLCDGKLGERQRHSRHRFSDALSYFAKSHSTIVSEMLRRYSDPSTCKSRDVLETALLQFAAPDSVIAVVQGTSSRDENFDHRLSQALRMLAVGETPSARWLNAVETFSVPLVAFRKQLFALMTDPTHVRLAKRCLEEIDQLRDEYGRSTDEPRHPDIASGIPWPAVQDTGR